MLLGAGLKGRCRAGVRVCAVGALASHLVERGVRRLLVAGGETSGAVTTALGIRAVLVGDEADPGVPWTYATTKAGDLALMLKSGNFGAPDLFTRALSTTGKE
ncbi:MULTISPECIES: nucleotide-binding domain containing protein [Streptomyces]|uniref:Nucleotide-binding domain containing protein n=1 Tax=Streptomyces lonegramiae TaxID=3075524 RepID=A0ABU2XDE4_9ACTN|nr:nucleotide-binding domain containing protein [Streptomyces sp. DSM 41529]MDT0543570.1 nucleotide-binding domain containing protein [Streptomyces sp. DSM 41529]